MPFTDLDKKVLLALRGHRPTLKEAAGLTGLDTTNAQTELQYLHSKGFVGKKGRRYFLTPLGDEVIQGLQAEEDAQHTVTGRTDLPPGIGKPEPVAGDTVVRGVLEVHHRRGVLYFHPEAGPFAGATYLRVGGLGFIPQFRSIDLGLGTDTVGRDIPDKTWQVSYGDMPKQPDAQPVPEPDDTSGLLVTAIQRYEAELRIAFDDDFKAGMEKPADADQLRRDAKERRERARLHLLATIVKIASTPSVEARDKVYRILCDTHGDGMATENLSTIADKIIQGLLDR